ncbi:uncharacterized protein LOC131671055 [Phymastichus coffea]|uniref:uncharacterized protein LOC131671055 n=1 Tax=Phymastichus coffea TaxID=108790 RepID=UPI00273C2453|nr:uncharacterized protein LOC131671055 [Phymastichus coffea]
MILKQQQNGSLFATEIGGPMIFTFYKVSNIEKEKLSHDIQTNGGKVIQYNERNTYTIVLTKKNEFLSDIIQFDLQYIIDCIKVNKILPLENYRLGKKVHVSCCYSQPFNSKRCIFFDLIQKGKCKRHDHCISTKRCADVNSDVEMKTQQKIDTIKNLIYEVRETQVKVELSAMENDISDLSSDESESLLKKLRK